MALLNYTTRIEPEQTIMEIQKILVNHGANAIRTDYDDAGRIVALMFQIRIEDQDVSFRLPTDWEPVLSVLTMQKKNTKLKNRSKIQATEEQARRVAWRVVKDWVEAQLAIVSIQMARIEQVFLPYATNAKGETMYDVLMKGEGRRLLLGSPRDEQ